MATLLESIFAPEQACDGHISITQVLTYLRCPESYRRKYILGEPEPPTGALIEGSAHHRALEYANRYRIELGESMNVEDHIAFFAEACRQSIGEADDALVWDEGESIDVVTTRGRKLIEAYHANVATRLDPIDVEARIDAEVGSTPLLGYTDLIARLDDGQQPVVVDYKTTKRAKSENDLANDLQMAIYAWALGVERVAFVSLCKTKTPKVEVVTATISEVHQAWAVHVVKNVVAAIQTGVFPPCDPGSWMCSPKFCGHWG